MTAFVAAYIKRTLDIWANTDVAWLKIATTYETPSTFKACRILELYLLMSSIVIPNSLEIISQLRDAAN